MNPKKDYKGLDQKEESSGDDNLVKVALSRGFFFPSAEIFGNTLGGIWDYGPLGLRVLNNVIKEWRTVLHDIGAIEIAGGLILPKKVLQASGHESNFFDVAILCDKCGAVYRVDKLLENKEPNQNYEGLSDEEYLSKVKAHKLRCEKCGGGLNKIKKFGSMFGLEVGALGTDKEELNAYLRPEACQSIFLDFKRLFSLYGKHLPFIIAQVGKAFRNEISPRNNLLRQREFYQNDIEIFFLDDKDFKDFEDREINIFDKRKGEQIRIRISKALDEKIIENNVTAYGVSVVAKFLDTLGFKAEDVRYRKLYEEKAFYSEESFDVEIKKDENWVEAIACNHRADYDLSSYSKAGGEDVKVDGKIPKIFEISAGTDRLFYLMLYSSMRSDSERTWFSLGARLAPFEAAVFPLLSKEELESFAEKIVGSSSYNENVYYLHSGSIGKMYRKADEIGVPFAFTVDYQTLKDGTVTIRDRDTMAQFRVDSKKFDLILKEGQVSGFSVLKNKFEVH
jgi:glycyl-tRNA synthetase